MMLEGVQWLSTGAATAAAIIVAARFSPRITGYGFVIFTASSLGWIVAGAMDSTPSLVVQNVVLTGVNLFGVYRWLIVRSADPPLPRVVAFLCERKRGASGSGTVTAFPCSLQECKRPGDEQ